MKIFIIIILILISSLFLFCIIVSGIITHALSYPHRFTREEQIKSQKEKGYLDDVPQFKRDSFVLELRDGYLIHGDIIDNNSNKYVIFVHGHGSTRESSLRYVDIFYKLGYGALIYDQRSHGDNVHKDVKMGYIESKDLIEVINYLKDVRGQGVEIALHGVSMGASTAIRSLKYTQDLKFVVSDCAFASLEDFLKGLAKNIHAPAFIGMSFCGAFLKIFHGYRSRNVNLLSVLEKNEVPLLIIHGTKDMVINVENSYVIYEHNKGKKQLEIFENAKHAASITQNKQRYVNIIEKFTKDASNYE